MVAPSFGDVQLASLFDGRDDGGADGSQVDGLACRYAWWRYLQLTGSSLTRRSPKENSDGGIVERSEPRCGYPGCPDAASWRIGPFASPADWRDGWIYFLMVDRFNNPSAPPVHQPYDDPNYYAFQGGTFRGVQAQLKYIKDLGASAIWISPALRTSAGTPVPTTDTASTTSSSPSPASRPAPRPRTRSYVTWSTRHTRRGCG